MLMTHWGLHLYNMNASLMDMTSVDGNGFPWVLSENRDLTKQYSKGTCPVADSLFERSILLAVPSSLTKQDEDDIIHSFQKVLRALL